MITLVSEPIRPEAAESRHELCDVCGFDGAILDDAELLAAIRDLGPRWQALLVVADTDLRRRPQPETWSAIEYAAHSRDITALHVFGVVAAIEEDEPTIGDIEDDVIQTAASTYEAACPNEVSAGLAAQAEHLVGAAARAGAPSWSRGLRIGGTRMDVRALLEHALHDSTHHLRDVETGLAQLRA